MTSGPHCGTCGTALPHIGAACPVCVPAERFCAAAHCTNRRGEGRFVGDFCAPCDAAMRSGKFIHGTSVPFKYRAALERIANQSAQDYADPEAEAYASREIARVALQGEVRP